MHFQQLWTCNTVEGIVAGWLAYSVQNLAEKAGTFCKARAIIQPVGRHLRLCRARNASLMNRHDRTNQY